MSSLLWMEANTKFLYKVQRKQNSMDYLMTTCLLNFLLIDKPEKLFLKLETKCFYMRNKVLTIEK